ncbi:L-sorbose 1-dehydrogenase [Tetrabaena socialis]|uniref:L-sorbose 1-dehydrogenase n=1 Tax=Tetrabaena socialis TaxID=47790 RepID=A0A2J7ZZU6_9CHLO|nr:L-sorbose 1-dehydrogenase [Tetrabaena socialis]|eukprot:PNH05790.1 L-sorbose 1-dehydrogenase [Tetrabaena socialis]
MCTGAVHTPHILMLSGVGPAAALREHELGVVADLAGVGANLQDHPAAVLAVRAKPEFEKLSVTSEIYDSKNNLRLGAVAQYFFGRRGPLTTTGCDHGAFLRTSGTHSQPDLQMRFVPGCALDPDGVKSYIVFGELKKQGRPWPGGITMQLLAIRAKSKGSIGLKAADPFINPAININYLSDPEDLATLRNGVRMARDIASQESLSKYLEQVRAPGGARRGGGQETKVRGRGY